MTKAEIAKLSKDDLVTRVFDYGNELAELQETHKADIQRYVDAHKKDIERQMKPFEKRAKDAEDHFRAMEDGLKVEINTLREQVAELTEKLDLTKSECAEHAQMIERMKPEKEKKIAELKASMEQHRLEIEKLSKK